MTVQNQNVKNVYRGNGSTTEFPFTFAINADHPEYIHVYITNDGEQAVETTDFACDMDARTVTYPKPGSSAPELSATQRLTIYRKLPYTQELNLVNQGPFFSEDVEQTFDDQEMQIQQLNEEKERSLRVGLETTNFDTVIPLAAGKTFRVKDDGSGFEVTEDPAVAMRAAQDAQAAAEHAQGAAEDAQEAAETAQGKAEDAKDDAETAQGKAEDAQAAAEAIASQVDLMARALVYDNIAAMKADTTLEVGQTAATKGYHIINDGGQSLYTIRAKDVSDVDDGGSIFFLDNGKVAELISNGTVNVKQFGAKGDGTTDDTTAIQNAVEYVGVNGGTVLFTDGTYRVHRNVGTDDKWGIKVTKSNITLQGNNASLRRYDTDITNYANAYPIVLVGVPDSDDAEQTKNIIIKGLTFIGEDTRHTISGNSLPDKRYAIDFKNTSDTLVEDCKFLKIDSQAINYQHPASYNYAESRFYNKTKNYRSTITRCLFSAEPHGVAIRALIHAIVVGGLDFCKISENQFEWCDDCVAGETTYNRYTDTENDTYTRTDGASSLGALKRSGRNLIFSGNHCYNSSEHAVYCYLMNVTIENNTFVTDEPTICKGDIVKIRGRGVNCVGNNIAGYSGCISVNVPAQDVAISGNVMESVGDAEAPALLVTSTGLSTFVSNRESLYIGGSPDYQTMRNISITGNTIVFPDTAVSLLDGAHKKDNAIQIYTDISDTNYPDGQLQNITINGNTIKGHDVGIYIINNMARNIVISSNSFYAKTFNKTGFNASTELNTYSVLQMHTQNGEALSNCIFNNNYVNGATYLFASQTGTGTANKLRTPNGIVGNRFEYIKNIKTADVSTPASLNQYCFNTGVFFLDRTTFGWGLNNSLGDGTTYNSYNKSCIQYTGSEVRYYKDDNNGYIVLGS